MNTLPAYVTDIEQTVRHTLAEDIGRADVTAQLVAADKIASARVIAREDNAIICGRAWVDEVFRQIDPNLRPEWQVQDGERVKDKGLIFAATPAWRFGPYWTPRARNLGEDGVWPQAGEVLEALDALGSFD